MIVMDIDKSGLPIQLETSKENEEAVKGVKGPEEDSTTEESSSKEDGDNDIENIPPIIRSGFGRRRKKSVSTRNKPVTDILDIVIETEYTPVVDLFKSLKPIEEVEKDAKVVEKI
jgi:hypothetical protein